MVAGVEEGAEGGLREREAPALVGLPFIVALPLQVCLVRESSREAAQELAPAFPGLRAHPVQVLELGLEPLANRSLEIAWLQPHFISGLGLRAHSQPSRRRGGGKQSAVRRRPTGSHPMRPSL